VMRLPDTSAACFAQDVWRALSSFLCLCEFGLRQSRAFGLLAAGAASSVATGHRPMQGLLPAAASRSHTAGTGAQRFQLHDFVL
jgi:hypothetical protein